MSTVTSKEPFIIKINSFALQFFKNGKNEQILTEGDVTELSIVKLEMLKDYILVKTADSKEYVILPKHYKRKISGDVIQSNRFLKEIVPAIKTGTISLQWKSLSGKKTSNKINNLARVNTIASSLENNVRLREESVSLKRAGLRSPQIGAIYSILSNSAISSEPITVVLPTGTGKTEAILGTIAIKQNKRSLIIVPSDALRDQFFKNCQSWGILRKIGIINNKAINPIVLKLASSLKNEKELVNMILASNIIIATASILNKLPLDTLTIINENVDNIFIDEAHHSAAPTWERLKANFSTPKIIQFTATPFREDGKQITGKIAFDYSLEEAQKNNFFTKIDFIPVIDYDSDNWDKTVSEKAVEVLRKDMKEGHDHILMARVDSIEGAKEIFHKYYEQYKEFNPILITSKTKSSEQLIEKIRQGGSKIVVCVNMLGEGIDIPQLKIAALHDIRKSLTVTLQFIGRFTRSNKSNSSAKIIANIADVKIEKKLKKLYKEDADWGKLIAFSSAKEIQDKIKFQEVLNNFKNSKIPLFNIKPKLSAVVYKSKTDDWKPDVINRYLENKEGLHLCDINPKDGLAICIYQIEEEIDWMDSKVFTENSWKLILIYFDKENKLLYVNSSEKNVDLDLVDKIIEVDFKFEKEDPFKCYHGLGHVTLFTLGLDKNIEGPIKYSMYAGSDIFEAITDMEKNKSSKSNTYGTGFKDGEEITFGASKNGKIWSRLVGNIQDWRNWCDQIGQKLLNKDIDVQEIFKGFLEPKKFNEGDFLNLSNPTSIDFPSDFYKDNESFQGLIIDGEYFNLSEIDLNIIKIANGYNIDFITEKKIFSMELTYSGDIFDYRPQNFTTLEYKKRKTTVDLFPYLKKEAPFKIRLLDGTFVENNFHFKPFHTESVFPLDVGLLTTIDWSGIDMSKESRGLKAPYVLNSVQNKIYELKNNSGQFEIIINDDNAGEAGDLLCFGLRGDTLFIEVIHCKYNSVKGNVTGSRIKDFYELCCQAQKTVKNIPNLLRLFDHIKYRQVKKEKDGGNRFLKGDLKSLEILIKSNSYKRPKIKVILVQPGLDKTKANKEVLELLGSTHTLLKETLNADFEVICS